MAYVPNPYNNVPGEQNSSPGPFQQFTNSNQIPLSQLPAALKQDGNLNKQGPVMGFSSQNHLNQSGSSSPAFNQSGMMPPPTSSQSSPVRPLKSISNQPPVQNIQNIPMSTPSVQYKPNTVPTTSTYPPNAQTQINNNAPPLVPSSQYSQPVINGPMPAPNPRPINQYPSPTSSFSPPPFGNQPPINSSYAPRNPAFGIQRPSTSMTTGMPANTSYSGSLSGPTNSPLTTGPQVNMPPPLSEGHYSFPEEEWSNISSEAKDLIAQLLVREASHRISAERVLQHPWLRRADAAAHYPPLRTPLNIKRNMSARNLSNFAESAMAVNRVIQQHFSMNYSYMERPPAALRSSKSCHPSPDTVARESILEDELERAGLTLQGMTVCERRCGDEYCVPFGLSPPTESELLRRRHQLADKPLPVH